MGQVLYETHFTLDGVTIVFIGAFLLFASVHPFVHWAGKTFNFPVGEIVDARTVPLKWGSWLLFFPLALWAIVSSVLQASSIQEDYRNGNYQTVEGYVEDFSTDYYHFEGEESFTVDGVSFWYTHGDGLPGTYCYVRGSNKGVITGDGQYLKIGYLEREKYKSLGDRFIIYIEELPPPEAMDNHESETLFS